MRYRSSIVALVVAAALVATAGAETPPTDVLDVAPVWAGHSVGFSLLTVNDRQLVGFYDADRRLTVAVRSLGEKGWTFVPLPRHTGWDSHNSIEMAVDRDGFVHLTADMHTSPLVSFRSRHPLSEPFTTDSFEPLNRMTGDQESRVTYPRFLHDAAGDLVFMYRLRLERQRRPDPQPLRRHNPAVASAPRPAAHVRKGWRRDDERLLARAGPRPRRLLPSRLGLARHARL